MTDINKMKIVMKYSDKILGMIEDAKNGIDIDSGDLQGMAEAIIMGAIHEASE